MYDDLNKNDKNWVIVLVVMLILAIVMLPIIFFDLFGFVDFISDSSFTPQNIRLYGGIFFVLTAIFAIITLPRVLMDTPLKSLEKYARTTENPEDTLEGLRKTWENGYQIRKWCRMDETYLIVFMNGAHAKIVPVKDLVWAYKTVTRVNFVKANTTLFMHYANGKFASMSVGEGVIDLILQQLLEKHRDIVVGHNRDLEKLYHKKDMAGLEEQAHQQRIGINI